MKNITINGRPLTANVINAYWIATLPFSYSQALAEAKSLKLRAARKYGFKDKRAIFLYRYADAIRECPTVENYENLKKALRMVA